MVQLRPMASVLRPACLCAGISLLALSGCNSAAPPRTSAELAPDPYVEDLPELAGESGPIAERQSPRRVGDLWVHRFSGESLSGDLILQEEVIEKVGDLLVVDFILRDGDDETHLRAHMTARTERIIRVSKVIDGEVHPAAMSDFESMMLKTTFVPESNRGVTAKKQQTCLVGKDELDCELTQYLVALGDSEATMTVARSKEMKRDLSGEITAVDGTILYQAELIEMQRGQPSPAGSEESVALASEDDVDVDFELRD